jgi:hypothetical protein
MTEDAIRTEDSRSVSGPTILISIDDGTITISDGELTDQTANHLRVDVENAGKLGKVLVALAAALGTDPTRNGDGKPPETCWLWRRGQHERRDPNGRATSLP